MGHLLTSNVLLGCLESICSMSFALVELHMKVCRHVEHCTPMMGTCWATLVSLCMYGNKRLVPSQEAHHESLGSRVFLQLAVCGHFKLDEMRSSRHGA